MKGSSFVKAMVLGNMGDGLCQLLTEEVIEISKQGVDFRFTKEAVNFMQSMFYETIRIFKNDLSTECEVLNLFKSVKLLDSTNINLPNNMEYIYKSCGASYEGHESVTKSAIKLQTVFDYLHQTIERLDVKEGIRADQGYKDHLQDIVTNDFLICDLGYFVPANFKKIAEVGAYFLSRPSAKYDY